VISVRTEVVHLTRVGRKPVGVSGRQIQRLRKGFDPDFGGITRKRSLLMDTTTASRRGRPPAPVPTLPLFLGAARTRVKEEITISTPVSRELRAYVDWAAGVAMMPDDEVRVRMADHAFTEYFKNDKAWQRDRAEVLGISGSAPKTSAAKNESPPPAPPGGGKQEVKPALIASSAPGKGS
jgi:hypothetical protein